MVYTESELIIPALKLLKRNSKGLTTTQLINFLTNIMKPTGKDAKINPLRGDTYFSQKVRNLTGSHRTLQRNGLATFKNGISRITKKGLRYLEKNELVFSSLKDQGFAKRRIRQEAETDYSGIIIEEGALDRRTIEQRRRSEKLRKVAIQEFKRKHENRVFCEACNFDFSKTYGKYGKDFIEVHHKMPVHEMNIRGSRNQLTEALKGVTLLCSNCHRIVHREKGQMLSISKLKKIIKGKSTSHN